MQLCICMNLRKTRQNIFIGLIRCNLRQRRSFPKKCEKKKKGNRTYVLLVYLLIKKRILMCPMVIISKADHSQNNCQKQNFLKRNQLHQIIVFSACIFSSKIPEDEQVKKKIPKLKQMCHLKVPR